MASDFTIIGQRIKNARLKKNMTQYSLAKQLGVSVAFLSRIESGTSHINLKRLSQICDILDTTEGEILNGTANSSQRYLVSDFNELLKNCSPNKQKLIYKVAKAIAEEE
ncbi:MAG: helix-turn-helix transcriptional regulator [Clostridia bacterium]|nr:helix-turn-helix transcriptional regulator [Clostridia bacterium]